MHAPVPLLSIKGLDVARADASGRPVPGREPLLRQVGLAVYPSRVLGLVGESGSGKSLTALAAMGLLPPGLVRTSGEILFGDRTLDAMTGPELRRLRGGQAAMILQNPMTCFDPILTVGAHFRETLRAHAPEASRDAAWRKARVAGALAEVGFPDPGAVAGLYPFQMSGGMLQRVMVAMALLFEAALLVADEPTTDLDVSAQATILDLIDHIRRVHAKGVLFITHDLSVVARMADEVAVMHQGRIVEYAPVGEFFAAPVHPHAKALVAAHRRLHAHDAALREGFAGGGGPGS